MVGQYHLNELPNFFKQMEENGNISAKQCERAILHYNLKTKTEHKEDSNPLSIEDPLVSLVESCIQNHMRKGSLLISIARTGGSKYDHPQFFERIITNPGLVYQEKSNHNSRDDSAAILMIIEKI